ncbi:hypothetical protein [Chryseobacterium sp. Mn2064]|uniref:hypothetical protein n=1 Tax=Chryseobacterium sp. Mn2064 TaxID=3395263 RepID=UPI003BE1F1FB
MEIYYFIFAIICFVIFGNLGIHLYYKRKHKDFIESLKGKKYTLFKKLNMEMESIGKVGFKYQFNTADVVFLDDSIFILLSVRPFGMAQPILQISNNSDIFPSISRKFSYDSKNNENGKLKIKGRFGQGMTGGTYTIWINFKSTGFDLNSIL